MSSSFSLGTPQGARHGVKDPLSPCPCQPFPSLQTSNNSGQARWGMCGLKVRTFDKLPPSICMEVKWESIRVEGHLLTCSGEV